MLKPMRKIMGLFVRV